MGRPLVTPEHITPKNMERWLASRRLDAAFNMAICLYSEYLLLQCNVCPTEVSRLEASVRQSNEGRAQKKRFISHVISLVGEKNSHVVTEMLAELPATV